MNVRSQNRRKHSGQCGFSLMEVLVAMVVGLIVVGAGFMIFQQASSTSRTTMSKTEMEQNGRASLNFIMQDISMANNDYQLLGVGVPQTGAVRQFLDVPDAIRAHSSTTWRRRSFRTTRTL